MQKDKQEYLISEAPALSTTAEASHPQLQHIKKETSQ
jgi:hypothetical protein